MNLSPILERLKSQLVGFKEIGSAADLEAVSSTRVPVPSCYLLLLSDSADENITMGAFEQRVTVNFAVILVASNRRDAAGAAAMNELEPLRAQIKAALIGWAPEPLTGEPVNFSAGRLLQFEDGLLWWAEEFRVRTYLRSA